MQFFQFSDTHRLHVKFTHLNMRQILIHSDFQGANEYNFNTIEGLFSRLTVPDTGYSNTIA